MSGERPYYTAFFDDFRQIGICVIGKDGVPFTLAVPIKERHARKLEEALRDVYTHPHLKARNIEQLDNGRTQGQPVPQEKGRT